MSNFRDHVLAALEQGGVRPEARDFLADSIVNAAETEYSARRRWSAKVAADARWKASLTAPGHASDTPRIAEQPAPKRAENREETPSAAKQDASHTLAVPPRQGEGVLPSGATSVRSGSPLSQPAGSQDHGAQLGLGTVRGPDAICAYCGVQQSQVKWGFELDHFYPRSAGGQDSHGNRLLACHVCNQIKGQRIFATLEEARQHIHHTLWRSGRTRYAEARALCFGGRQPVGAPPASVRPQTGHPGFDEFWGRYPRKVGKAAAQRAWDRRKPPLDPVLAALTWQRESAQWTKDEGAFVPHPATWLNAERWTDERPPAGGGWGGGGGGGSNGHRTGRFVPPPDMDYGPIGEQKL